MVYVQGGALVVTPKFPFTLLFLPEIYSLEARVPLSVVASVEPRRCLLGQALRIAFAGGTPPPLELRLHDSDGFVRHLGKAATADSPQIRSTPEPPRRRYRLGFFRAFMAVWGTAALLARASGLLDDYRYRRDGSEIAGVFDSHSGIAGQRNDMGNLAYSVDSQRYHLTSLWGNGLCKLGDMERLFYMPGDPRRSARG